MWPWFVTLFNQTNVYGVMFYLFDSHMKYFQYIYDLTGGNAIVTESLKIGSRAELSINNVTFTVKDDGYYFIVFVLIVAQEVLYQYNIRDHIVYLNIINYTKTITTQTTAISSCEIFVM